MDCTEAAEALNAAAAEALLQPDFASALEVFEVAQRAWMKWGAWDSEPSAVFYDLAERIYGREAVRQYA